MITVGSLFSGIAGFEAGFDLAGGFKTLWQVEIDADARRVLRHHFPDAELYEDVRKCGKRKGKEVEVELATVDVIVGGFP